MQLSQSPVSFTASLKSNAERYFDRKSKTFYTVEKTPQEVSDTYDRQIAKIQLQKQRALELDIFMKTNDEVQDLLKQLPEQDTVSICSTFRTEDIPEDDTIELDSCALSYNGPADNDFIRVQNDDEARTIDYKGIINWLKNVIQEVKAYEE